MAMSRTVSCVSALSPWLLLLVFGRFRRCAFGENMSLEAGLESLKTHVPLLVALLHACILRCEPSPFCSFCHIYCSMPWPHPHCYKHYPSGILSLNKLFFFLKYKLLWSWCYITASERWLIHHYFPGKGVTKSNIKNNLSLHGIVIQAYSCQHYRDEGFLGYIAGLGLRKPRAGGIQLSKRGLTYYAQGRRFPSPAPQNNQPVKQYFSFIIFAAMYAGRCVCVGSGWVAL